jgi:hypothetical protein
LGWEVLFLVPGELVMPILATFSEILRARIFWNSETFGFYILERECII